MTAAATAFAPEPVPLVRDEAGRLMVVDSRISLDILVSDFKRGRAPEAIRDTYETVSLAMFTQSLRSTCVTWRSGSLFGRAGAGGQEHSSTGRESVPPAWPAG